MYEVLLTKSVVLHMVYLLIALKYKIIVMSIEARALCRYFSYFLYEKKKIGALRRV